MINFLILHFSSYNINFQQKKQKKKLNYFHTTVGCKLNYDEN